MRPNALGIFQLPRQNHFFSEYMPTCSITRMARRLGVDVREGASMDMPVNPALMAPPRLAVIGLVAKRASRSIRLRCPTSFTPKWRRRLFFCYHSHLSNILPSLQASLKLCLREPPKIRSKSSGFLLGTVAPLQPHLGRCPHVRLHRMPMHRDPSS